MALANYIFDTPLQQIANYQSHEVVHDRASASSEQCERCSQRAFIILYILALALVQCLVTIVKACIERLDLMSHFPAQLALDLPLHAGT